MSSVPGMHSAVRVSSRTLGLTWPPMALLTDGTFVPWKTEVHRAG